MGELIKYGIKLGIAVSGAVAVVAALVALANVLSIINFSGPVGEVFSIIGCFMPWNAIAFNGIFTGVAILIATQTAMFIWNALSAWNSQTS